MFLVFDLETTGFKSIVDDVVEFSYIKYDDNCRIIKAESLYFYYEGMSWSEEAYAVHQLSREFLKQYEDQFEINCRKMYAVLMYANVCGHNALAFDVPFAVNWLNRMGLPGLSFRAIEDTMLAFKPITGRAKIQLGELGRVMGITEEVVARLATSIFKDENASHAHNAGYDVMLTGLLATMAYRRGMISFEDKKAEQTVVADTDLLDGDYSSESQRDPEAIIICRKTLIGTQMPEFANTKAGYNTEPPTDLEIETYDSLDRVLWAPFSNQNGVMRTPEHLGTYFVLEKSADKVSTITMYHFGIRIPNPLHMLPGRDKILQTMREAFKKEV